MKLDTEKLKSSAELSERFTNNKNKEVEWTWLKINRNFPQLQDKSDRKINLVDPGSATNKD